MGIINEGAARADARSHRRNSRGETDQEAMARQYARPVLTPLREDPPAQVSPPPPPIPQAPVAPVPEPQKDKPVDEEEDTVLAAAAKRFSLLELD